MAIEEEYLDNLLKSLTDSEDVGKESKDGLENEEDVGDIDESQGESFLDSLDLELDNIEEEEEMNTDAVSEQMETEKADAANGMKDAGTSGDGDEEISEAEPESVGEAGAEEKREDFSGLADSNSGEGSIDDPGLLQMFEDLENADSDLAEINSLLSNASMNEDVDDDMLALLENAGDNHEYADSEEAFDIFAEGELAELSSMNTGAAVDAGSETESDDGKKKKKKPGFLAKIITLLTKTADESNEEVQTKPGKTEKISDENAKLLEELNGGGAKKATKDKKKASKKDKKKKEKQEAKPKPQKVKKKKEKEKKPVVEEKPVKILNKQGLAAIVALCATLIASILILSSFLPQYASKQTARTAFKNGDYETTYELFYKKRLSKSEKELYNKAKTVLRMERKLDSYNNNIAMNRELEAVDALLLGVKCYEGLHEADTYGVRQEVDNIYQQICNILESNYGISQEEAVSITKFDNVSYTKRLKAIVGELPEADETGVGQKTEEKLQGTEDNSQEPAEAEESSSLEDILPEEEDMVE